MTIKRYITIQAIKTKQNELIPIWNDRVLFEKTELYGNAILLKGEIFNKHFNLVECVYDLKTKKVEPGIELDYYPSEEELEFKKDEIIFFEKSHRNLAEAKISKIVYEEFEMEIKKGYKLEDWWLKKFKDITIITDALYAIKRWKPFYILDNGIKIEWEHQMYHKCN